MRKFEGSIETEGSLKEFPFDNGSRRVTDLGMEDTVSKSPNRRVPLRDLGPGWRSIKLPQRPLTQDPVPLGREDV